MEQLSDIEIQDLSQAGSILESLPAWDTAVGELERRMSGIIQRSLLGRLETYEEYLAARAEYSALYQLRDLPGQMKEQGAQ